MSPEPLVKHIYTADPSAHVFNGKLYVYPSHDIATDIEDNDNGDQYAMEDYHVLSMSSIGGEVTDHGVALAVKDIPWAQKQVWAPDAAFKNGKYYFYFPARDHTGIFRIGVAESDDKPEGPFTPDPEPIPGSYSIDPAIFIDNTNKNGEEAYLYFGGIWGGQLQCWDPSTNSINLSLYSKMEPTGPGTTALFPRVAKLNEDMHSFAPPGVQELIILAPETGKPIEADDHERRFFEAAWMHVRDEVYYFSYSTGDTHFLCYATGSSPLGPFVYRGRILDPVVGWTTHHSIVQFEGRWWLFYHDASLSGGKNHLRCVKVREIFYDDEGGIKLVEG